MDTPAGPMDFTWYVRTKKGLHEKKRTFYYEDFIKLHFDGSESHQSDRVHVNRPSGCYSKHQYKSIIRSGKCFLWLVNVFSSAKNFLYKRPFKDGSSFIIWKKATTPRAQCPVSSRVRLKPLILRVRECPPLWVSVNVTCNKQIHLSGKQEGQVQG